MIIDINRKAKNLRNRSAFTLLETLLALIVISLLMGSVFSIALSTSQLSSTVAEVQQEAQQKILARRFLEKLFTNLPADSQISLLRRDDGAADLQIIEPGVDFPTERGIEVAQVISLSGVPEGKQLFTLQIRCSLQAEDDFSAAVGDRFHFALLSGLTEYNWEIYDEAAGIWVTEWDNARGRAKLLSLSFRQSEIDEPQRILFQVYT